VRDELWQRAVKKSKGSGAILQIWTDKNPQGFSCRQHGERERKFVDFEGLTLIKIERRSCKTADRISDTINT
jgi:CRISPR-associated protein Cas2